jgi:DNA repair exonuclease SbcCD nuclease subunit
VDIQGNHDRTRYGEAKSWIESFADQGLLTHLDVATGPDGVRLRPVPKGNHVGSFVEWSGCRIFGMRYLGASTERILREIEPTLAEFGEDGAFTILVAHAGLEGIVPNVNAELTASALEALRGRVDYLALGHLHKHYTVANLAYNGGSLETWAMNEWGWQRGLLQVDVDTSLPQPVTFRLVDVPRRPFVVIHVDVNQFDSPRALLHGCWDRLQDERRRYHSEWPVVSLTLRGRLRFDQQDLPINKLEDACREAFDPLVALVREDYDARDFVTEGAEDGDEPIDRAFLEQSILRARFAEDERYAPYAGELARLAIDLKERALRGADGSALLNAFRDVTRKIRAADAPTMDATATARVER